MTMGSKYWISCCDSCSKTFYSLFYLRGNCLQARPCELSTVTLEHVPHWLDHALPSLSLLRHTLSSLCWVSVMPTLPVLESWWASWHWKRYFGFEKHFLRTSVVVFLSHSCVWSQVVLRVIVTWWSHVVGSCCAVTDCTIFFFLRSDSVSYSSNCPRHVSLDIVFSNHIYFLLNKHLLSFIFCLCLWTPPPSPLTVAESYRGLDTQRGAASSPTGQLQRCQSESQEAPASLIHPLLAHQGQGPLGRGMSEGGGAGENGVQGGFPGEGLVFPRSSWVWCWSGPTQQCGHRQQRSGGSRRCLTGGGLPLHLFTCFTFTPGDPRVAHQPRPYTVVPAGGEGERGVGWAHIDWSEEGNLLLSFCFVFPLFPRDTAAIWVEGQAHRQTPTPRTISSKWAWRAVAHAASKTCKTGPFFSTLTEISPFSIKISGALLRFLNCRYRNMSTSTCH